MDIPVQEKRNSLLVVRFTESEMTRIKAFKKSNKQINISFIVRDHLLRLIDECTNVHTNVSKYTAAETKNWKWTEKAVPVKG